MPLSALALVLVAACIHAAWNLLAKRADAPALHFVWGCSAASAMLWAVPAVALFGDGVGSIGVGGWVAVVTSGLLHSAYFIVLQRGYQAADLSVVYPVARGVGPLLSASVAIVLFAEPLTVASLAGLCLIVVGTFTIAGGASMIRGHWSPRARAGLLWGAATGVLIACYTVNDARAVKFLAIAPLLFDWMASVIRTAVLAPLVILRRSELVGAVRRNWPTMLAIGAISPLGYILVLYAMTMAPVSRVAPAREVSMLIAAFLGSRLLGEGSIVQRVGGAGLIAFGVACLATSG